MENGRHEAFRFFYGEDGRGSKSMREDGGCGNRGRGFEGVVGDSAEIERDGNDAEDEGEQAAVGQGGGREVPGVRLCQKL